MPLAGTIVYAADITPTDTYTGIIRETAAQSIGNGSATPITFSTEDYDPAAGHSGSGSTYTPGVHGLYLVIGSGTVVANAAGRVELRIRVVSTDIAQVAQPNSATSAPHMCVGTVVELSTTDTVSLVVFQNSGGSLNTSVASGNPRLAVTMLKQLS